VFENCYRHRIQFDGTAYLNSKHVLAMSSKENTKFDRNPADVNVATFIDILLVIEDEVMAHDQLMMESQVEWADSEATWSGSPLAMADSVLKIT